MIALRPGETAEEAVERTTEATIDWDGDDGPAIVGNDDVEATGRDEATDEWMEQIVGLLRREHPGFTVVDEPRDDHGHRNWVDLDDPDGPVTITVYGDQVQLLPRRGWDDPDGQPGLGFRTMWRWCQLLAAQGCVAQDPDEDEIIDLELDEDEAAASYNWM